MKAAVKRGQSQARLSFAERKQARYKCQGAGHNIMGKYYLVNASSCTSDLGLSNGLSVKNLQKRVELLGIVWKITEKYLSLQHE